jgi:hypothetical protein
LADYAHADGVEQEAVSLRELTLLGIVKSIARCAKVTLVHAVNLYSWNIVRCG